MSKDKEQASKGELPVKVKRRLDWAQETLASMLAGDKPALDPNNPDQSWLYEQMIRMHADFFISEVPKSYVTLPGEGAREAELKGITKIHPLSHSLIRRKENIDQHMEKQGVRNYKILGVDYGFRTLDGDPLEQTDYADAFILARGDLYSLWQFVSILKAKLENDGNDAPLADKALVIQNSGRHFWQALVDGLEIEDHQEIYSEKTGLRVTRYPNETEQAILDTLGEWAGRAPKEARSVPHIPAGAVLLLQTGNSKKIYELQDIMNVNKTGVKVYPFSKFFPKPEEADELSRTYVGNNFEKMEKTWERLDEMSPEAIKASLEARGLDPANTFLIFDDRGLESDTDFFSAGPFDECREYLNDYKPSPGAELAHVLKSMSLEDFYARIAKIAVQIEKSRAKAGDETPVDLGMTDISTYMVSRLLPDENGRRDYYAFAAATRDDLIFKPRPASDIHKYSEHYLIPRNIPGDNTKAEIEGYVETMSPMALAATAAIKTFGMDRNMSGPVHMSTSFKDAADKKRWAVGTQFSLYPDKKGHGSRTIVKQLNGGFRFLDGKHGNYALDKPTNHQISLDDETEVDVSSALNNFQRFAIDSDCFVLTAEAGAQGSTISLWQRLFVFYSLIVGKQIFDPAVSSKPLTILEDKKNKPWQPMIDVYTHLHKKSLIGDKPRHLFRIFESAKSCANFIKRRMNSYVPDHIPLTHTIEMGEKAPEDLFRVTVFCSASSTNALLRENAKKLGFQLAAYGFALKNGGGSGGMQQDFERIFDENGFVRSNIRRTGLMIETSLGVHEFRKWWAVNFDEPAPKNWVESIQCEQTFQSEGLCEFNDRSVVHPNIYHRMDDLSNTEAFIVDAGGAGTIQEIAGMLMLREAGLLPVENTPFIIIDTVTGQGKHKSSIYGPLIDMIPEDDFKKLNIHVVQTVDEALTICREARQARGMTPDNLPDYEELLRDRLPKAPVQAVRKSFRPD